MQSPASTSRPSEAGAERGVRLCSRGVDTDCAYLGLPQGFGDTQSETRVTLFHTVLSIAQTSARFRRARIRVAAKELHHPVVVHLELRLKRARLGRRDGEGASEEKCEDNLVHRQHDLRTIVHSLM